jgi:hypothetical protein
MMPSTSLLGTKGGNVVNNIAELGLSAESFLLLLSVTCFHAHTSFLTLTVTYTEVTYAETGHLVTYTKGIR